MTAQAVTRLSDELVRAFNDSGFCGRATVGAVAPTVVSCDLCDWSVAWYGPHPTIDLPTEVRRHGLSHSYSAETWCARESCA